jgi:hypothetical protein
MPNANYVQDAKSPSSSLDPSFTILSMVAVTSVEEGTWNANKPFPSFGSGWRMFHPGQRWKPPTCMYLIVLRLLPGVNSKASKSLLDASTP